MLPKSLEKTYNSLLQRFRYITVREQQELSNKLSDLRDKIRRLPDKISPIKRQIKELEEILKTIEKKIAKVDIING